ncbi:MAG: DUF86 domain-containing protein [Burkholderiales bacterium]
MQPESLKLLHDILEAVTLIAEFCENETMESYAEDTFLRSAVERQFIVAGEALSQLGKADPATFERVPDCAGKFMAVSALTQ